jgi:hypothetical protein
MSVKELYEWYKTTYGEDAYSYAVTVEDDWRYVKGLADGLNNSTLKEIAVRMDEHARFLRCLNQDYYKEENDEVQSAKILSSRDDK